MVDHVGWARGSLLATRGRAVKGSFPTEFHSLVGMLPARERCAYSRHFPRVWLRPDTHRHAAPESIVRGPPVGQGGCEESMGAPMKHEELRPYSPVDGAIEDDFSRQVYCLLGTPVDAMGMSSVLRRLEWAAIRRLPFFLSTPNLNYLVNSRSDADFREALLRSDLCPADGMSIVWLARLIGIPIKGRVAGSDILATFKTRRGSQQPLKVFLFGGAEGVAAAASRALNARQGGVHCVGSLYPGFGSVDEMSSRRYNRHDQLEWRRSSRRCIGQQEGTIVVDPELREIEYSRQSSFGRGA